MKRMMIGLVFLFVLGGCQANSTDSKTTDTSTSSIEKNSSKPSEKRVQKKQLLVQNN